MPGLLSRFQIGSQANPGLPLPDGGLGFPVLDIRWRLRRILHTVGGASCRSVYNELIQGLLRMSLWNDVPWSDGAFLQRDLSAFQLAIILPSFSDLRTTNLSLNWVRDPTESFVVIVSNGFSETSVVVFDEQGVLVEINSGVLLEDPSSWVGLQNGWERLLVCISCIVATSRKPCCSGTTQQISHTGSHLADCCIPFSHQIACLHQIHLQEGVVPAAHDTGSQSMFSLFENRADSLAKQGLKGATT